MDIDSIYRPCQYPDLAFTQPFTHSNIHSDPEHIPHSSHSSIRSLHHLSVDSKGRDSLRFGALHCLGHNNNNNLIKVDEQW